MEVLLDVESGLVAVVGAGFEARSDAGVRARASFWGSGALFAIIVATFAVFIAAGPVAADELLGLTPPPNTTPLYG
ncbi:unnamed protein product [Larinioides sclopetarius]|uniref:Uncharacterized protein n=1 Tax=Larinioides sclopetarius TaxID=280406 RepID=A0AAV2AD79_9ARAC